MTANQYVRLSSGDCAEDAGGATIEPQLYIHPQQTIYLSSTKMQLSSEKRGVRCFTNIAKLLFAAKRARPDIQTAIAFLCTRMQAPDEDDWKKLVRVLGYVKETIFLPLTLGWDGTGNIYWYVGTSFAAHHNMRSHTGAMMTFGQGAALY